MKNASSYFRKVAYRAAALLPFNRLRSLARAELVCVNYHSIKGWRGDALQARQPYRTAEEFEKDILFLKHNYQLVTMEQLIAWKKEGWPLPPNSLFITIDDGLKVVYDKMFPILEKHGIKPALFINPAFVDNADLHYRRKADMLLAFCSAHEEKGQRLNAFMKEKGLNEEFDHLLANIKYSDRALLDEMAGVLGFSYAEYLAREPVYLSSTEIKELRNAGWIIGAHSMDHPPYKELSIEEQVQQTLDSVSYVSEHFDAPCRLMAYPSNDSGLSLALFDETARGCDLSFGVQGLKKDVVPNHIHRIALEGSGVSAPTALKTAYLKYTIQKLFNKTVHQRDA
ncbi:MULTISPECIES: polysaccharide deacetylase family protein [unclassified Carboxylicivirga]|uniref:polysaccharide deacetylase family protein n=1 Tax=Carboxylicivirga TaxID=1628153 RepID=UPI003D33755D